MEQQQQQAPRLFTFEQFAQRHGWITQPGLRAQRFDSRNEDRHGFGAAGAFVEIGRKVLIDEERYFAAVAALNAKPEQQRQRSRRGK